MRTLPLAVEEVGGTAIRAAKRSCRLSCRKATADVAVALILAVHNDPRSRAWDLT
jgi:hypothetical protein